MLTRRSPNFGPRRNGLTPHLIVLHYTAMASAAAAADRLCDPAAEVSSHYLIARDGTVISLVPEEMRAWHAGAGEWAGQDDINSHSIGIELDNDGTAPFSAPLMDALETLMRQVMQRWAIPPAGVIGHSDMAPGRKSDPGPHFDWQRLERTGLARQRGHAPAPPDAPISLFRDRAKAHGFTANVSDTTLLAAVRLRFRPWATGPLIAADIAALARPTT